MANLETNPTIYGFPTKYASLLILVVQNSALVLTMRYSRIQPGPQYLSSTAVVLSELLKCVICLFVHIRDHQGDSRNNELPTLSESVTRSPSLNTDGLRQLYNEIFGAKSGFVKLLIPAVLYTLQNNLQFVAATNLDAATFQVTYQCKILTTALFAVILLHQSLSWKKWISLLILTVGVACVQLPSSSSSTTASIGQSGNYLVGLIAVAIACLCSGFAGVYFEKVLKNSGNNTSIWIRNIQLSVGCLAIAVTGTLLWDGKAIAENGFFQGYNFIVVATICIQAAGGLIVAMVIKYADNILKGFATSLSIILSTVASIFFFDFIVTSYFLVGTVLVLSATYLYSSPDKSNSDQEKMEVDDSNEKESMMMMNNDDEKERFLDDTEMNLTSSSETKSYPRIEVQEIEQYEDKDTNLYSSSSSLLINQQTSKGSQKENKVYDELGLVQ